jgi:NAD(P)H-hydrate epimerase
MKPVVDSATMRLLEEKAFFGRMTAEVLMDIVGDELATFLATLVPKGIHGEPVLLISGKGNNGADGYTALLHLLEKDIPTCAWQLFPPAPGSILEKRVRAYTARGGRVISFPDIPQAGKFSLIVDGIYGAGFKGSPDEASSKAILWANAQHGLIVSIDLPSGVDPTTGEVPGEAIFADYTVSCHLPKSGCFLGKGWEHTGCVHDIPLPLESPKSDLCLLEEEDILHLIPRRRRTQNKYQAGSVLAIAGSPGMMGAASLACEAAYKVGAGYVRALLPKESSSLEGLLPRETVKSFFEDVEECLPFFSHADSAFIGPGLGRTPKTLSFLDRFWSAFLIPTVVDADALFWLSTKPLQDLKGKILTPHLGEASRLFQKEITQVDEELIRNIRSFVATTGCILALKGAPTFIFSSGSPVLIMPRGDPGMATAGSGDVLSGMMAGFLAQKIQPISACILASWAHGLAGEFSAKQRTSYSTTASSILESIPQALSHILEQAAHGSFRHYVPFGRAEPTRP